VKLSIVIPVLDEAPHLPGLLTELAELPQGVEVIVADGGSRDGSRELAAGAPGVTVVSSERGRARQMNAGAAAATGEVLLFLHADTRLPAGACEAIRRALDDPSIVYGRFDVRFDNPSVIFRLIAGLMNVRSRWTGICTGDQAILVARAAFQRLRGYPEIALMEDIELTRRLKRVGRLAPLRLRVTTSARRWERDGVARTILFMWMVRLLYFYGVGPERLNRWYYGTAAGADRSGGETSGPVVLQGSAAGVAPATPPARALDPAPQKQRGHREHDENQERHTEPAVGVGSEPRHRALLDDERDQHGTGPEQRSTSHGATSSLREGRSKTAGTP
jgi:rSAM/selenodomain-associated transferase 2